MNPREHCLRIRRKVRIEKLRSRVWELSRLRYQSPAPVRKNECLDIVGCTAQGRFCFCIDCLYERDPEGCVGYRLLWKAEVKYSILNKPAKAEGVRI